MSESANPAMERAAPGDKPTRQRLVLLGTLFLGIFIAYLDRVNVSVLAANDLFLTDMGIKGMPVQIGLMMSVFLASYGIANVTLSPLGDYLGPRRSMILCILLWNVSLLVGGMAAVFSTIVVSRVLLGIGEGFYYPLQSTFVKNWFPPKERGRANAFWIIGQSVAPAVAMPFFTYLIADYGWRSSFTVSMLLGFIPMFLLWRYTADTPRLHKGVNKQELRHIEEGLAQEAARQPASQDAGTARPTLWMRVKPFVTDYRFWLLVTWYTCLQCMYWGLVSWLPSYLKTARGFTWAQMGWLASLPFILGIGFKALSGVLCDKIGRSAPVLAVSMGLAGLLVYLGTAAEEKYLSAVLLATAMGLCTMGTPAAWTLLQSIIPGQSISTASGMMNGIANGSSSLSPVLIGLFISLTGGYQGGLFCLVVTGVVATAVACVLMARKY